MAKTTTKKAKKAEPVTEAITAPVADKEQPKRVYGLFDLRSTVVTKYTDLLAKTQKSAPTSIPALVGWIACKNMDFLWWIKTDIQEVINLLKGISDHLGIVLTVDGKAPASDDGLPDFTLGNGMKVIAPGTQAEKDAA